VNLHAENTPPPVETPATLAMHDGSTWKSFFVWGWFPTTMMIDAAHRCGGEDHVRSIETENSLGTGFVCSVAGYYINVYCPWRAHVTCDH
jgi:hypothetical protein